MRCATLFNYLNLLIPNVCGQGKFYIEMRLIRTLFFLFAYSAKNENKLTGSCPNGYDLREYQKDDGATYGTIQKENNVKHFRGYGFCP